MTRHERVTTLLVTHDVNDAIQLPGQPFFLSARPAAIAAEIATRSKATVGQIARR